MLCDKRRLLLYTNLTIEEFVTRIDSDNIIIELGNQVIPESRMNQSVMLVTHDLNCTGAASMLFEMAKVLNHIGYTVFVLSGKDGALHQEYVEAGINVIIYENYFADKRWFRKLRNQFDFWVINTLVVQPVYLELNNTFDKVFWWIHESEFMFETLTDIITGIAPGKNVELLATGPYVQKLIKTYTGIDAKILNFGIKDTEVPFSLKNNGNDKIRFLQIGQIDGHKGQEILADAIDLLSDPIRSRCEFIFCTGLDTITVQEDYLKIVELSQRYKEVTIIETMPRADLLIFYDQIDGIIVPSRAEATSAVMVEGLMKGKIGICSDNCGIKNYITNRKSGFIFKNGDSSELAAILTEVVENYTSLDSMRLEGRKVYENIYSDTVFRNNILSLIQSIKPREVAIKSNPLVSVLLVTCNNKMGVIKALDSIYHQTYQNFEVIVVDDCSSDGTLELVDQYFGNKENMIYILNDTHIGYGKSFNLAAENASGEYYAFIQDGDEWIEDKLERQLEVLSNDFEYDAIYALTQKFQDNNEIVIYPPANQLDEVFLSGNVQLLQLIGHKICISSLMMRKTSYLANEKFNELLDENACNEYLIRVSGKIIMAVLSYVLVVTDIDFENPKNIDEFLLANCSILINQASNIEKYGYKRNIFNTILAKMNTLGKVDEFLQIMIQYPAYQDIVKSLLKIKPSSSAQNLKSVNISEVQNCIGCGNCAQICPVNVIQMKPDQKGFLQPVVENEKCIQCGQCVEKCPLCNEIEGSHHSANCYAMQADLSKRMISSSGGIFPVLAEKFTQMGGYVAGAVFNPSFELIHIVSNDISDVKKMYESKYVQSNLENCFSNIESLLKAGQNVLFSGTPCQNAALKAYLGKKYDNLYQVGIVCHGVPSPGVFKEYLSSFEKKYGAIKRISFRSKEKFGWDPGLFLTFVNGQEIIISKTEQFMKLFLDNVILRDSCYHCNYKDLSYGDILLGDFWGINQIATFDDGYGTSYVSVFTDKGNKLFQLAMGNINKFDRFSNADAVARNKCIQYSVDKRKVNDIFWNQYSGTRDLNKAITNTQDSIQFDVAMALMWSNNYGNALTNYALYKELEKLGKKVVVLDNLGTLYPEGNFKVFAEKHYECSSDYINEQDYITVNKLAETFLVGSDQTFNYQSELCHGYGDYYQLSFVDEGHRKVSYASSFGASFSYKPPEAGKQLFQKFDAISVREDYGVEICEREYDMDAKLVMDPVFLLNQKDYLSLVNQSKLNIQEPFIVTYILNPTKEKLKISKEISKKFGNVKIYNIIDAAPYSKMKNSQILNYENILFSIPVEDWLYYISNSLFVITDSFHGVCFSLIFQKKFLAIRNRQSERFDIFSKFGDPSKFILTNAKDFDVNLVDEQIDYDQVEAKIKTNCEDSVNWLRDAIR